MQFRFTKNFRFTLMKTLKNHYKTIIWFAILSRTFILIIGKLSSMMFEPFDKSTLTLNNNSIFKYLISWDAIHFINIAEGGYSTEHSLAFFPLPPLIVRVLNFSDVFTTAVLINIISSIISSLILFKISYKLYNEKIAYLSTIFFIFNPASVVYCSFYTESIFCLFFYIALYNLIINRKGRAAIFFAMCSGCRSNGAMNIIFQTSPYFIITILPIAIFQIYSFLSISRITSDFRPFMVYSHIQRKYWGQGFLKFLVLQQTPNILLGISFLLYSIYILKEYFKSRIYLYNLKMMGSEKTLNNSLFNNLRIFKDHIFKNIKISFLIKFKNIVKFILDPFFTAHSTVTSKCAIILMLQTLTVIFFIHWNMCSRFISFNPILYWSAAVLSERYYNSGGYRFCVGFFMIYMVAYALFFSCFYPPA